MRNYCTAVGKLILILFISVSNFCAFSQESGCEIELKKIFKGIPITASRSEIIAILRSDTSLVLDLRAFNRGDTCVWNLKSCAQLNVRPQKCKLHLSSTLDMLLSGVVIDTIFELEYHAFYNRDSVAAKTEYQELIDTFTKLCSNSQPWGYYGRRGKGGEIMKYASTVDGAINIEVGLYFSGRRRHQYTVKVKYTLKDK